MFCSYDVVVDVLPEVKWITPDAYKNLKVVVDIDDESSYKKAAETEFRTRHKELGSLRIVEGRNIEVLIASDNVYHRRITVP